MDQSEGKSKPQQRQPLSTPMFAYSSCSPRSLHCCQQSSSRTNNFPLCHPPKVDSPDIEHGRIYRQSHNILIPGTVVATMKYENTSSRKCRKVIIPVGCAGLTEH